MDEKTTMGQPLRSMEDEETIDLMELARLLSAAVDQNANKPAQSFRFITLNRADMLYCASFPQWEAGVFALLEQKCRSPPFLP